MRIVIDGAPLQWHRAGIGTYVYELVRHLAQLAPEHEYVCYYNSLQLKCLRRVPDFAASCVRPHITRLPSRLLYCSWGSDWSRYLPLDALTGAADVIHYTNHLASFQRAGRAVVTVYDLSILRAPQWHPAGRRRLLAAHRLRWSLERAAVIAAISSFTRDEIVEILGIPAERIIVTPLGVEPEFLAAGAREPEPEIALEGVGRGPFILNVATLEPRKNLTRLIQAYALARRRASLPHRLVLAGMRGWLFEDIFRTVRGLGLEEQVVFPGYLPRGGLPRLMRQSALFVYPSLYEGFGLPPLEAMACGTPTIVSHSSALPEVVGQGALTVDPYDVEALAEAMCRVLTQPALARELSCLGRERARQFSWERTARTTLEVYMRAVEQPSGNGLAARRY